MFINFKDFVLFFSLIDYSVDFSFFTPSSPGPFQIPSRATSWPAGLGLATPALERSYAKAIFKSQKINYSSPKKTN